MFESYIHDLELLGWKMIRITESGYIFSKKNWFCILDGQSNTIDFTKHEPSLAYPVISFSMKNLGIIPESYVEVTLFSDGELQLVSDECHINISYSDLVDNLKSFGDR